MGFSAFVLGSEIPNLLQSACCNSCRLFIMLGPFPTGLPVAGEALVSRPSGEKGFSPG